MAKDRQSSWASGELTADLHGAVGSPAYRNGAALLRNFMVTPQGTIVNRTGSQYLATLGSQTARLVSLAFGDDSPRILQFYGYGSFITRSLTGVVVGSSEVGAEDFITPTLAAVKEALRAMRVAQCAGTVMFTITSPSGVGYGDGPKDIRRAGPTSYVGPFNLSFAPPLFGSSDVPFSTANNKRDPAVMTSATGYTVNAMAGDGTHPARPWDYVVTRVVAIEDGNADKPNQVLETSPRGLAVTFPNGISPKYNAGRVTYSVDSAGTYTPTNVPNEIAVYGDWTQRLDVGGAEGDPWTETAANLRIGSVISHRVYRGRDGVFGFIGETRTRYFVDDGRDPDLANPPPVGSYPFDSTDTLPEGALAIAFANDRRFIAGIKAMPQKICGSAVSNWNDFQNGLDPDDADALSFDLAANQHQGVRHLLPGPTLLAFTGLAVWSVTGSGDLEVITPTNIAARKVLSVGSAHYPAPMEADNGLFFFVEAKGRRPYQVKADANGAAQLVNLAVLSSHLFRGRTIVDWAWQRDPHLTLWVVRDDGVLLSLCSSPQNEVSAWAQHTIAGGGLVESVCTLPVVVDAGRQVGEDLLYMAVRRGDALMLERLTPQVTNALRETYLDCATIGDDSNASSMVVTDISVAGSDPYVFLITTDTADAVEIDAKIVFYASNGMPIFLTVTNVVGTAVTATADEYSGGGPVPPVTAPFAVDAGLWGEYGATSSASQFADGTLVTAVVDGAVFENLPVAGGQVALPMVGIVRIVGLPYVSKFQALPVEQDRGRQKQVTHITLETIGRGGQFGVNFDPANLKEIPPRLVSDGYGVIASRAETTRTSVPSSASEKAVVVVQQAQPKPFKILAIEREYVLGG